MKYNKRKRVKDPISITRRDDINGERINMKIPHYKKALKNTVKFDPDTQYAVIRSSICTGEKVAGFKNKKDGHFVEVMVIRTPDDEQRFKTIYGLDNVRTEY